MESDVDRGSTRRSESLFEEQDNFNRLPLNPFFSQFGGFFIFNLFVDMIEHFEESEQIYESFYSVYLSAHCYIVCNGLFLGLSEHVPLHSRVLKFLPAFSQHSLFALLCDLLAHLRCKLLLLNFVYFVLQEKIQLVFVLLGNVGRVRNNRFHPVVFYCLSDLRVELSFFIGVAHNTFKHRRYFDLRGDLSFPGARYFPWLILPRLWKRGTDANCDISSHMEAYVDKFGYELVSLAIFNCDH